MELKEFEEGKAVVDIVCNEKMEILQCEGLTEEVMETMEESELSTIAQTLIQCNYYQ